MATFCSTEWIDELDHAVQNSDALRESTKELSLTIRQTVTGRPEGDFSWHIVVDHGAVRVFAGAGDTADVTFSQDAQTARAVASGAMSAQAAFMLGRLRIGGDVAKLISCASAFDDLEDQFGDVRTRTTY